MIPDKILKIIKENKDKIISNYGIEFYNKAINGDITREQLNNIILVICNDCEQSED